MIQIFPGNPAPVLFLLQYCPLIKLHANFRKYHMTGFREKTRKRTTNKWDLNNSKYIGPTSEVSGSKKWLLTVLHECYLQASWLVGFNT